MALTAVQICNLALGKLGDVAKVTSITDLSQTTGDASMQAYYCSLFYTQALNVMLDEYSWYFATRTANLNALSGAFTRAGTVMTITLTGHNLTTATPYTFVFSDATFGGVATGGTSYTITVVDANTITIPVANSGATSGTASIYNPFWAYSYSLPADFFGIQDVRDLAFLDSTQSENNQTYYLEGNVLYSNLQAPVIVYTSTTATNPANFQPLFVEALSTLLAAYLAGPIIKGDVGVAAARQMMQLYTQAKANACNSDGQYRKVRPNYIPAAVKARGGALSAWQNLSPTNA